MKASIKALEEAIKVLSGDEGGLLGMKFDLRRVLTIGGNILDRSDLKYLEQQLDADVPRINKKSPFKKKYSAAGSKKVLTVLEDMKKTFEDNLKDAEDKEKSAKETYDSLMESKGKELETAQSALTDGEGEGGARDLAKEEA